MKYKIILVGIEWVATDDNEVDFLLNTWEETVEKAKFFLDQGFTIEIQNIIEE